MESKIRNDGGSAFPQANGEGVTLRDYFAAKAMQGECSHPQDRYMTPARIEMVAKQSYAMADAMLKARES